jgi:cellulose biosynthesis protein BcsQ
MRRNTVKGMSEASMDRIMLKLLESLNMNSDAMAYKLSDERTDEDFMVKLMSDESNNLESIIESEIQSESKMDISSTAKVLTFFSHKGGVGKTFFTINFTDYAVHSGNKVLLIDMDPQMNLTSWYLKNEEMNNHLSLLDLLMDHEVPKEKRIKGDSWAAVNHNSGILGKLHIEEMTFENPNLNLMKGSFEITKFNNMVSMDLTSNSFAYPKMIKDMIDQVRDRFDLIIIDLNPSFSSINQCFLMYSDYIFCPLSPDVFCKLSPKLLHHNLKDASTNTAFIGSNPTIGGFFMNMMKLAGGGYADSHTNLLKQIKDQVEKIQKSDKDFTFNHLGDIPNMQSVLTNLQDNGLSVVKAGLTSGPVRLRDGGYLKKESLQPALGKIVELSKMILRMVSSRDH